MGSELGRLNCCTVDTGEVEISVGAEPIRTMTETREWLQSAKQSTSKKKLLSTKTFKILKCTHEIANRYELGRQLGKGSFGEVRACTNRITGEEFAIKIIDKEQLLQSEVLSGLMESELEVLAKTDHPHIIRVIELLEDERCFYIVSELVHGGELYDFVIKNKMFTEKETAGFVK
jgi:calcium-dependent protein kinase